jgi:hypothetical protein
MMRQIFNKNFFLVLVCAMFFFACNREARYVQEDKFIGKWELQGRGMFEGLRVEIKKEDGKLKGKLIGLNTNKYIRMFSDSNDTWVSSIKRISDFEFRITERKPGADFMSLYGVSTSQEYKAVFIDDNTIGLATDPADPFKSSIVYKRIEGK